MAVTAVAASMSVAQGLGKPLCAGSNATSLRGVALAPRRSAARMAVVRASSAHQEQHPAKEWAAAAAVAAALVLPEVAEAAPGISPSLKNFLLSIVSGGVVLVAIVGAVVAVSNFDPVKRR
uniref:Ultraviolet-B-repressible protein n=1 Tax=Zea mays TaxID=4577 RepID=B6SXA1_MAIZE|nr:ultraviolet-B-repressible protein [Zea mays]ACG30314.1 ultraviolet-B-repressible protein [Zea mays]ACG30441.1 ultraviolet-B-repressible protein [Zea mays]